MERREGESKFEYIKRLTQGKRDKTLDIDYSEWAELVYGQAYSSDVARRMFYGVERLLVVIDETEMSNFSDDDKLIALKQTREEIIKERKKLQATKLEYNRNLTHDSRFELFYENIKDAFIKKDSPIFVELQVPKNNRCAIVGIADLHYGANFISENNTYSIKECERRFNILLANLKDYVEEEKLTRLKVLNAGDSIQGILRMTDLKLNEIAVVDAVVGVSKLIASFLNELSSVCEVEYIHVGAANHSQTRPLGSKASEFATEDMEKVIVNYIHDVLENNKRVVVYKTDTSDRVFFKVFEFECAALHGHQIKNVKNSIKDLSMLHRRFFDYVFLGHRHSANQMIVGESDVNAEVITIPSFIGSCPYSDSLFLGAKAMAQVYLFDEKYGHINTKNIILN